MTDYFSTFGLDRTFSVDRDALESAFHEMQKASHPDRHVNASMEERGKMLSESSTINRAYRTLRDSVARARHLLDLYGFRVGDQKQVPPTLLMTVMEAQEKIAELADIADSGLRKQKMHELGALAEDLDRMRVTLDTERLAVSRAWDVELHAETSEALSDTAKAQLNRMTQILAELAYIHTLYESIDAARHGRPAIIKH